MPGGIRTAAVLQVAAANLKTIEGLRKFLKSDKSHKTQKITQGPHCSAALENFARFVKSQGVHHLQLKELRNLDLAV